MGPSGAGKSTLLYCLMGTSTYGRTTGRLWVNGREMRLSRLRRVMGYVPQACPSPSSPHLLFSGEAEPSLAAFC